MDFDFQISPIPYEVKNASQNTGLDTTSDTVSLKAGGNTDIVKVTSTKISINDDGDDVDLQIDGDTVENLFYINAGLDAVGFNTNDPVFTREGTTRASPFLSLRLDTSTSNAGAFAISSDTRSRAVDVSFLRSRGTWNSKQAVQTNDDVANLLFMGHDGTDFVSGALIRANVETAVSSDTVGMRLYFLTSQTDSTGLTSRMIIRSAGLVVFGDGTSNAQVSIDSTTGQTIINEQANSSGFLRVEGVSDTNLIRTLPASNRVGISASAMVSTFEVAGSYGGAVTTLNASTLTLTEAHATVVVTFTVTGAVTITLPSATSCWNSTDGTGRKYIIVDGGANALTNNITINRAGSDTIITPASTSATSVTIATNGGRVFLQAISATQFILLQD